MSAGLVFSLIMLFLLFGDNKSLWMTFNISLRISRRETLAALSYSKVALGAANVVNIYGNLLKPGKSIQQDAALTKGLTRLN